MDQVFEDILHELREQKEAEQVRGEHDKRVENLLQQLVKQMGGNVSSSGKASGGSKSSNQGNGYLGTAKGKHGTDRGKATTDKAMKDLGKSTSEASNVLKNQFAQDMPKASAAVGSLAKGLNVAYTGAMVAGAALETLQEFLTPIYQNFTDLQSSGIALSSSMFDLQSAASTAGVSQEEAASHMKNFGALYARIGDDFNKAIGENVKNINFLDSSMQALGLTQQEALDLSALQLEARFKTKRAGEKLDKVEAAEQKKYIEQIAQLSRTTGEARTKIAEDINKALDNVSIKYNLEDLGFDEGTIGELMTAGFDSDVIGSIFKKKAGGVADETYKQFAKYNRQALSSFDAIAEAEKAGASPEELIALYDQQAKEQASQAAYLEKINPQAAAAADKIRVASEQRVAALREEAERQEAEAKQLTTLAGQFLASFNWFINTADSTLQQFWLDWDNVGLSQALSNVGTNIAEETNLFANKLGSALGIDGIEDMDLGESVNKIFEAIGDNIIEAYDRYWAMIANFDISTVFDGFDSLFSEGGDVLGDLTEILGQAATDLFNWLIDLLPDAKQLQGVGKSITKNLIKLFFELPGLLMDIMNFVVTALYNGLKAAITFAFEVDWFELVYKILGGIGGFLWGLIEGVGAGIFEGFEALFGDVTDQLKFVVDFFSNMLSDLMSGVKNTVNKAAEFLGFDPLFEDTKKSEQAPIEQAIQEQAKDQETQAEDKGFWSSLTNTMSDIATYITDGDGQNQTGLTSQLQKYTQPVLDEKAEKQAKDEWIAQQKKRLGVPEDHDGGWSEYGYDPILEMTNWSTTDLDWTLSDAYDEMQEDKQKTPQRKQWEAAQAAYVANEKEKLGLNSFYEGAHSQRDYKYGNNTKFDLNYTPDISAKLRKDYESLNPYVPQAQAGKMTTKSPSLANPYDSQRNQNNKEDSEHKIAQGELTYVSDNSDVVNAINQMNSIIMQGQQTQIALQSENNDLVANSRRQARGSTS
ncbi:phage tail protein [Vibrio campbellii]|uniref:phage tail protein n=1 Tax=Vibrio campbellii TaxID=680 RepID=UPI0005EE8E6E|nr:hypothetical protein [Vibrio campbellii]